MLSYDSNAVTSLERRNSNPVRAIWKGNTLEGLLQEAERLRRLSRTLREDSIRLVEDSRALRRNLAYRHLTCQAHGRCGKESLGDEGTPTG